MQLSEQIRPWDTLACCWDVKQPTNKQTNLTEVKTADQTFYFTHTDTGPTGPSADPITPGA